MTLKGEAEKKTARLYLYIFLDRNRVAEEENAMVRKLMELRAQVESGETEFKPDAQKMIDSFLEIKRRGKRITTRIRDDAWQEAQKYFGIFVLISNQKSKVFETLAEYRLRKNRRLLPHSERAG